MSIGFAEVREAAYGQWSAIHKELGITIPNQNHKKHTKCPACGGSDRFRVTEQYNETGHWICSGGGNFQSGDGFALLEHCFGWGKAEQLKAVKEALGLDSRMSERERSRLRRKAEESKAKTALQVRFKNDRAYFDKNILDLMYELEDSIKGRQWAIQQTGLSAHPLQRERNLAKQLNDLILSAYHSSLIEMEAVA